MFRSKKKKINAGSRRVVRTFDDEEDENDVNQVKTDGVGTNDKQRLDVDEPPSALMIALQRKKDEKRNKKRLKAKRKIGSGGPVVMSFDIEEDDENDDDDQHRKKKKKRKKGLGFGGGGNFANVDGDARKDDEMASFTTSTYGKDALEQLKSEQKRQTVQRAPLESTVTPNEESMDIDATIRKGDENLPEESFIPLDDEGGGNDTRFENYGRKKGQAKDKIFVVDDPPQDESHGWERQIEQRAGLRPSSQPSRPQNSKLLSLDELSEKLESTVETIDRQREELENSTNRLRADREHAKSNSKDHQKRLKQIGLACEFYQSTRRDLTLWVGALRDLHEKVQPIATAFTEMLLVQTKEFGQEFRSWQDDCVATLYQNRSLDRVLGRQPESTLFSTASNETVIDEFGRDIGSQYQRDRELRFKKRLEYINHNEMFSNDDIIKREDHDEEERAKILREALSAALEDLDQEYTSVTHLKSIFDGWFTAHFDDYQQCFATLSFGDLYAVLVQVELCKSNFFPDILSTVNESSSGTESSILELDRCLLDLPKEEAKEEINVKKVAKENEGRLARAVEKGVLPILLKILSDTEDKDNDTLFCLFFSATKSSLVSTLAKDIAINRSSNSSLSNNIQNLISAAIRRALEGVSIPLFNKDVPPLQSSSEALDFSVRFSRKYLVQILQQALCNIIIYWFPLIDLETNSVLSSDGQAETGIHYVLNFINDKYLVLLSSMENVDQTTSESPSAKHLFKKIWEALRTDSRNIIESPSLMLLTMPLRAAARAYQLD